MRKAINGFVCFGFFFAQKYEQGGLMAFCKMRETDPLPFTSVQCHSPILLLMWAGSPSHPGLFLHTCRNEKSGKENLKGNLEDV